MIRIKLGDVEVEISGNDKEFVSEKYDSIIKDIKETEAFKLVSIHAPTTVSNSNTDAIADISITPQDPTPYIEDTICDDPISQFANDAGVSHEQMLEIFDFSGSNVYIHKKIVGNTADKQRIIAKLLLLAYERVLKVNELSGRKIGEHLREIGIETSHLSENLKTEGAIITQNNKYRLNHPGKKETLNLIKELLNSND